MFGFMFFIFLLGFSDPLNSFEKNLCPSICVSHTNIYFPMFIQLPEFSIGKCFLVGIWCGLSKVDWPLSTINLAHLNMCATNTIQLLGNRMKNAKASFVLCYSPEATSSTASFHIVGILDFGVCVCVVERRVVGCDALSIFSLLQNNSPIYGTMTPTMKWQLQFR